MFCGSDVPDCSRCVDIAGEREKRGKRAISVGKLRPNVVLYGEENSNGESIGRIVESDIREGLDLVLVVETCLKVPGAKRLARELCQAARVGGGKTVWINKKAPPSSLKPAIDLALLGDCDDCFSLLSSVTRI